jgi:hypothetical protein
MMPPQPNGIQVINYMKKLFILAATLITLQAQSSNLVQSLRLTFTDEVGATNNTSINLDANEAQGFFLNYIKDIQSALQLTNPVPTFQNSIRQTTRAFLLRPLADQAKADEWKTNKIDAMFIRGVELRNAGVFTQAQLQALKDIAKATNVVQALGGE